MYPKYIPIDSGVTNNARGSNSHAAIDAVYSHRVGCLATTDLGSTAADLGWPIWPRRELSILLKALSNMTICNLPIPEGDFAICSRITDRQESASFKINNLEDGSQIP